MSERESQATPHPRTPDTVARSDSESASAARANCWLEEGLTLKDSWSLVERLYALPF
jgi:hypothetical protein